MVSFFLSWELWQEMTFVLACGIVVVCAVGLVKLWWTNRSLQKLEVMDEEKRTRLLEMRYCGMNANRIDEIPFGIRAIQRGVEVEGVWIVRPAAVNASRSATPVIRAEDTSGDNTRFPTEVDGSKRHIFRSSFPNSDGAQSSEPLLSPRHTTLEGSTIVGPNVEHEPSRDPGSSSELGQKAMATYVPTGSPLARSAHENYAQNHRQSARSPSGGVIADIAAQNHLPETNAASTSYGVAALSAYSAEDTVSRLAGGGQISLHHGHSQDDPNSTRRPKTLQKKQRVGGVRHWGW